MGVKRRASNEHLAPREDNQNFRAESNTETLEALNARMSDIAEDKNRSVADPRYDGSVAYE